VPTLVIVAGRDEIIPGSCSEKLISELGSDPLEVVVVEAATHNDIQNYPLYYRAIGEFMGAR
jgi:fermentation-respiration switch protein FrsA (DUF1100 family)